MQTTGAVLLAVRRCSLARTWMLAQGSRSAHGLLHSLLYGGDWRATRPWGERTPSTMRSDAAFETANKAAAPLAGAGGAILAVCGILAAVLPRHLAGVFIFGGVGVFLVFCVLGAATGVRASRSVL